MELPARGVGFRQVQPGGRGSDRCSLGGQGSEFSSPGGGLRQVQPGGRAQTGAAWGTGSWDPPL